jgi:hypothetical protein
MGPVRGVYTSRGRLTRYTVTSSVNTGDFVHLTRYMSRYMPLPEPLRGRKRYLIVEGEGESKMRRTNPAAK